MIEPQLSRISSSGGVSRSPLGIGVDLLTAAPGVIDLEPEPDHRLIVHAGEPVAGACARQRLRYARGHLDLFPAGYSEPWEAEGAVTSVVLRLEPSFLRRVADEIGIDPGRAGLEPHHQFRDPQIEPLVWVLDAERRNGFPNGSLYRESLGIGIAVRLLGGYSASQPLPKGLSPTQLQTVTSYVEEHLDQNLSLDRLAQVAGISASHLKTLFKRSTGLPVHEYVVRRRVERARRLLLRGELPASQVALEAGFAHQSHMARCVKRLLGVSPRALTQSGVRSVRK